jgi:hypothetical protein
VTEKCLITQEKISPKVYPGVMQWAGSEALEGVEMTCRGPFATKYSYRVPEIPVIIPKQGTAKMGFSGGRRGGGLSDPQPKFPRSFLDAPIMSIRAPCRPRRCKVFDRKSSGAARRWLFGTGGRSKGMVGMVAGCMATPLTAPSASKKVFKLFLRRDTSEPSREGEPVSRRSNTQQTWRPC